MDKILHIIEKWRLNQSFLAKKTGMLRGTFHNKLSHNHRLQFSEKEEVELRGVLLDLRDDITIFVEKQDYETI